MEQIIQDHWLNFIAFIWFLACFAGYMRYASKRAYDTPCLANTLHNYRVQWMQKMLTREMRIADNTAIANLERGVSFFASTTMLILAGLMTVLGSTEKALGLVADLPFIEQASRAEWEIKVILLIFLFVYAFFKFTWSLRQYGFVSILIGGAAIPDDGTSEEEKNIQIERTATMASMAAHNFNLGLRTYYFSIAMLAWLLGPELFMISSAGVVYILYRREFKSSTLQTLMIGSTR